MKSCKPFIMLISRDMEDDLTAMEKRSLEAHLSACSGCRCTREEYQALRMMIQSESNAREDPPLLRPSVKNRKIRVARPFLKAAWKLAAMFLIVIGLYTSPLITRKKPRPGTIIHFVGNRECFFMNDPFGAMAYYRHFAGQVVQTQFFSIDSAPMPSVRPSLSDSMVCFYDSPLFQESGLWEQYEIRY